MRPSSTDSAARGPHGPPASPPAGAISAAPAGGREARAEAATAVGPRAADGADARPAAALAPGRPGPAAGGGASPGRCAPPGLVIGALREGHLAAHLARARGVAPSRPATGGPAFDYRLVGGEVGALPASWLAGHPSSGLAAQLRGEASCARDAAGRPLIACTSASWAQVLRFFATGTVARPVCPTVVAEARSLGLGAMVRRLHEHQPGIWLARRGPPPGFTARVHLLDIAGELGGHAGPIRHFGGLEGRHWQLTVSRAGLAIGPLGARRAAYETASGASARVLLADARSLTLPLRPVAGAAAAHGADWADGPHALDELVSCGLARTEGALLVEITVRFAPPE